MFAIKDMATTNKNCVAESAIIYLQEYDMINTSKNKVIERQITSTINRLIDKLQSFPQ